MGREGRGEEREGEREGGRKGGREKGREGERKGGRKGGKEREGGGRGRENIHIHLRNKKSVREGESKGGRGREGTLFPGHTFLVSNTNSFPLRVATFPNESLGEKRIG